MLDDEVFVSADQFRDPGLIPPTVGLAVTFNLQVDLGGLEAVNVNAI